MIFAYIAVFLILLYAAGPWFVAAGIVAAGLWAYNRYGSRQADKRWRKNIAQEAKGVRAVTQDQAYQRGDDYGVYGVYPPAKLDD